MNASKQRYRSGDLGELFGDAGKVVVAKGKKVLTFDMKSTDTADPDFRKAVIGPSGYLRAPTIRMGKTVLVGFHPEAFEENFS